MSTRDVDTGGRQGHRGDAAGEAGLRAMDAVARVAGGSGSGEAELEEGERRRAWARRRCRRSTQSLGSGSESRDQCPAVRCACSQEHHGEPAQHAQSAERSSDESARPAVGCGGEDLLLGGCGRMVERVDDCGGEGGGSAVLVLRSVGGHGEGEEQQERQARRGNEPHYHRRGDGARGSEDPGRAAHSPDPTRIGYRVPSRARRCRRLALDAVPRLVVKPRTT